jgi:hypothetical protein
MNNTVKLLALAPVVALLTACGSTGVFSNPLKDPGIKLCEYTAENFHADALDPEPFREAAEGSEIPSIKAAAKRLLPTIENPESAKDDAFGVMDAYFTYSAACSAEGVNQPMGRDQK